ncbi:MAG TPA: RodZ domain-containing protein [Steroidobacteraceae bacterium]|nr:RodZ domain-containing protein [Steroidobacteraceae bacterium]
MEESSAAPSAPAARSIGERLRAGRERAGLSMAAAAEKLHLDIKVIEALESDRFADLGASVYVRGHLRRYADFVGEPGIELVNAYNARAEARPPPPDLTQIPHAELHADPRRMATPLIGLGGALVLVLAIWWVLAGSRPGAKPPQASTPSAQGSAPTTVVTPPAAGALPVGNHPAPASAPAPASGSMVARPATSVTSPAEQAVSAVPAGASTAAADAPRQEQTAPPRTTRLRLQLANDSWVEVYDSRGERLFYDVASAGSVQSLEGRAPLRVVLGNAGAVDVQVDGQRREIPPGALDGDGASFVVNRSGALRAR